MTEENAFYWPMSRDSLLTPAALTMFRIAAAHDGESFNDAKVYIDQEYETARGLEPSQRHGGNFQTFVRVFEEAGWMWVNEDDEPSTLNLTEAGVQALLIVDRVPGFLRATPFYLLELLSRYQLHNPSGPEDVRNVDLREAVEESNIFPYWTIWKIMRSCNNRISVEELRRFVFRLQRSEDIEETINQILAFRDDVSRGIAEDELNARYPVPLEGAVGEPKYIMARAGTHIGPIPPVITKPDLSTYELNSDYLPLIDDVLDNEPIFRDVLDANTWFQDYGSPVEIEEEYLPFAIKATDLEPDSLPYTGLDDDDPILLKVELLLNHGKRNILFEGAPGTSKTTYALLIGARLANYDPSRFTNIQFHQSMSYDDFMEGYVPVVSTSESAPFKLREKVFLRACERAAASPPDELHVVVIDEMNRGDPSRIFGESLTYIERRNEFFRLAYSGNLAKIPENLVVLATLNPFDKTIADLDQALDRRFEKISMPPDRNILRKILVDDNAMPEALAGRVIAFFDFLSASFENRIGHAYFKDANDESALRMVWEHQLHPVLEKELQFDEALFASITEEFEMIFRREEDDTADADIRPEE